MSIVVLKRKAQTKYNKISSHGKGRFSLNNPRRVESKSGRGRVQTQTPMKGNVPRGHGGCCGNYPVVINQSQYVNDDPFIANFSDPKVNTGISVKNHSGSMAVRHKWLKGTYPNYIVKDMEPLTYGVYNSQLSAPHAASSLGETTMEKITCVESEGKCNKPISNFNKKLGPLSYDEYYKTKFLNKNCLPPPQAKLPVPRPLKTNCTGCGNGTPIDTTSSNRSICN